jgi:flagellar protein FlaG
MSESVLIPAAPAGAPPGPREIVIPPRESGRATPSETTSTDQAAQAAAPEKAAAAAVSKKQAAAPAEESGAGALPSTRMEVRVADDGVLMVKVLDARTDKVVRELPPEELVESAKKMRRYIGVLLARKA